MDGDAEVAKNDVETIGGAMKKFNFDDLTPEEKAEYEAFCQELDMMIPAPEPEPATEQDVEVSKGCPENPRP